MAGFEPSTVGLPFRETRFTFKAEGIKKGDDGKAVTLVMGADKNLVKLVENTDPILGRIETVEVEMNGDVYVNVLMSGGMRLDCAVNEVFKAGDTLVPGVEPGLVKAGTPSTDLRFFVSEPDSSEGFVGVIKL